MVEHDGSLFLTKDYIGFLITLFSTLTKKAESHTFVQMGNKLYMQQKNEHDITKLNFDTKPLHDKIFTWVGNREDQRALMLTAKETEQFKACVHAAYYFRTENPEPGQLQEQFIQVYEQFFKSPSLE